MDQVTVYGADWCEDTERTRARLDALRVPYRYVDIDQDAQAKQWVKDQNRGKQQTPTVDIAGRILIEPPDDTLEDALRKSGVLT
jgi:mycoredoxin